MFPSSHPPNNTQGPIPLLPFHHLLFLSFHLTTFKISSQSDGDNLGPLWLTTVKGVEGMHGTSLGQCALHSQGHRECHASSSRTPPHVALASETQVKGPIFALWQGWPTFRRPSQRCAVLASLLVGQEAPHRHGEIKATLWTWFGLQLVCTVGAENRWASAHSRRGVYISTCEHGFTSFTHYLWEARGFLYGRQRRWMVSCHQDRELECFGVVSLTLGSEASSLQCAQAFNFKETRGNIKFQCPNITA